LLDWEEARRLKADSMAIPVGPYPNPLVRKIVRDAFVNKT
jgi:hypothetical protein